MRVSYSACKAWWDGRWQDAVNMMLHEESALPITTEHELKRERAMAFGHGFHKCLELESKLTGRLPAMFEIPLDLGVLATEIKLTKELPTGDILSGQWLGFYKLSLSAFLSNV